MNELVNLRTPRTKTFDLGGNKRKVICASTDIHYPSANGLLDNDKTVVLSRGTLRCETLPFKFALDALGVGYTYSRADGSSCHVKLTDVDGLNLTRSVVGDFIVFENAMKDIDIKIRILDYGVRVLTVLKSDAAQREFTWTYTKSGEFSANINTNSRGSDGRNRPVHILNDVSEVSRGVIRHVITWDGKAIAIPDPSTRIPVLTDEFEYPITIDPDITETSTDAGWEYAGDGNWYTGGWPYYLEVCGTWYYSAAHYGVRFTTVAIPPGATIDLATLKLYYINFFGDGQDRYGDRYIVGSDTDDAAAWSNSNGPSDQTATAASVIFPDRQGSSQGMYDHDVTDIVQEIVDRAGWASGNDIAFYALGSAGGFKHVTYWGGSVHPTPSVRPVLEIDYTEAGATGSPWNYYAQQRAVT